MSSFNQVGLQGRLGADPELTYSENGTALAKVNIAVDIYKKGENTAAWIAIKVFGKTAENLATHWKKGDQILVAGRLDMDTWNDKETGKKQQRVVVIADRLSFCGSKRDAQTERETEEIPF